MSPQSKNRPIEIIPAGDLKAKYRISLGDSYVLGAARVHGATVVGGDQEFKPLEGAGEIGILWLPQE